MITKTARGFKNTVLDPANIGMPLSEVNAPRRPVVRPENMGMPLSQVGKTHVPAQNMGIRLDQLKKTPVPPQNMGMPVRKAIPPINSHPERLGIHVDDLKPARAVGKAAPLGKRFKYLRMLGAL